MRIKPEWVVPGFAARTGISRESEKESCVKKLRGTFFADKKSGERRCRGWCCDDFKVSPIGAKQCSAARGKYFGIKTEAERFCNQQKGWCCRDGKIFRKTLLECREKGQKFYTSDLLARQSCRRANRFL